MLSSMTLLTFIRDAVNAGWSHDDRLVIIRETWSEIKEISGNLLDEAILVGKFSKLNFILNPSQLG